MEYKTKIADLQKDIVEPIIEDIQKMDPALAHKINKKIEEAISWLSYDEHRVDQAQKRTTKIPVHYFAQEALGEVYTLIDEYKTKSAAIEKRQHNISHISQGIQELQTVIDEVLKENTENDYGLDFNTRHRLRRLWTQIIDNYDDPYDNLEDASRFLNDVRSILNRPAITRFRKEHDEVKARAIQEEKLKEQERKRTELIQQIIEKIDFLSFLLDDAEQAFSIIEDKKQKKSLAQVLIQERKRIQKLQDKIKSNTDIDTLTSLTTSIETSANAFVTCISDILMINTDWPIEYQGILASIPAVEEEYGGTLSDDQLEEIKPRLIELAKQKDIEDYEEAAEEIISEALT